jgi:hypothetical protein
MNIMKTSLVPGLLSLLLLPAERASAYYDPAAQRWLNRDPVGLGGGMNVYAFLQNGRSGAIDPLGLAIVQNRTDHNIIVSGGAGVGEGHWPGNELFAVLPPGGVCGGADHARLGYPTRESALQGWYLPTLHTTPSSGTLYDVDYYDRPQEPHTSEHYDVKVSGDDQGPHIDITGPGNRHHRSLREAVELLLATARRIQGTLNKCRLPWWP